MYDSDISIQPGQGWANIQLGFSVAEVRAALAINGHAYDLSNDELTIDIHAPEVTFYFDDSEPKKLVQVVFYDKDHRIDGQQVIGVSLAEALLPLNIQSYEDTLWSLVSIEEEYPKGKPLPDSQRTRKATLDTKLECGTLWIKSQGVGLVMLFGVVHAIALRIPGSQPTVGCGQLDSKTMELALSNRPTVNQPYQPEPNPEHWPSIPKEHFPQANKQPTKSTASSKKTKGRLPVVVFSLLAIVFLVTPITIVYRDLTAWKDAKEVVGRVVGSRPEGPFPDELTVEYTLTESEDTYQVTIPIGYTSAREIGQEVELDYLPDHPERAMTRIQTRDEGFSISPYFLFGSIGLATFCLHIAFPNHIRLNSRRR